MQEAAVCLEVYYAVGKKEVPVSVDTEAEMAVSFIKFDDVNQNIVNSFFDISWNIQRMCNVINRPRRDIAYPDR